MKCKIVFTVLLLYSLCSSLIYAIKPWTWLYTKNFNGLSLPSSRTELFFTKLNVPSFTQLIFSWNSLRPMQGYFSYWVQVRNAVTKVWHEWHHMIDWGAQIQKSYANTSPSGTKYHHVRLEVPRDSCADALRIKIVAHDYALLTDIKSIAVNIANFNEFESEENLIATTRTLPSFAICEVPAISQMLINHPKNNVLCSPTSCCMLLQYLMKKDFDTAQFANNVFDYGLQAYGSWPFNTAHAFECTQGKIIFRVVRLESYAALYKKLQQNLPIIVSVRGKLPGAPQEYANGHLLVVTGWDQKNKKVLCHDPAWPTHEQVAVKYDLDLFCAAWERSRRLAYIAERI